MKEIFDSYGINLTEEQLKKFEKYYELLIEYNERFNITAITKKEEVIVKHFVDSIYKVYKLKGSLIDVGSGGGFPAIPLKIINENLTVTCLEATGKKCEFLRAVGSGLNLDNFFIVNGRAEDIAKDNKYREKFDYCSARAVARLNTLSEYCMPFVKVGGKFISFKGDYKEELIEAKNAIKTLGGVVEKEEEFELNGAKRGIIYVKKVISTDKKYPRGRGKERKCPL